MKHVRAVFESVPWTRLRPAQDLIAQTDGKDDPAKFVAVAATPDRKVIVAYFPAGAKVAFVPAFRGPEQFTWFDPRTGEKKIGGGMNPPDDRDWVLVIRQ
jgi:hypothetical protein